MTNNRQPKPFVFGLFIYALGRRLYKLCINYKLDAVELALKLQKVGCPPQRIAFPICQPTDQS